MTQVAPSGSSGSSRGGKESVKKVGSRVSEEKVDYDPRSVLGEISVKEMGSRAGGSNTDESKSSSAKVSADVKKSSLPAALYTPRLYGENVTYKPTNPENQQHFEQLITAVHSILTEEAQSVVITAADSILETIKDIEQTVLQKQKSISELLSMKVNEQQMGEFYRLCKPISDYGGLPEDEGGSEEPLAVVFDEAEAETQTHDEQYENGDDIEPIEESQPGFEPTLPISPAAEITVITTDAEEETRPISFKEITKDFLYNQVSGLEPESGSERVRGLCKSISRLLAQLDLREDDYEQRLMEVFDYKHLVFVRFCVRNRAKLHYGLRLLANRKKSIAEMREAGLSSFLVELGLEKPKKRTDEERDGATTAEKHKETISDEKSSSKRQKSNTDITREPRIVDLDGLVFEEGPHLMVKDKTVLPKGSFQENSRLYDTITVPAPAPPPSLEESGEKLVAVSDMPEWAQAAFPSGETTTLNRVQSKIYPLAFESDENLLLCAPTGAGKTNVAMLSILRVLSNHRNIETGKISTNFKAVYVAPLKALATEQMREFERRLSAQFGIKVNELTGDLSLSQREIAELQVLVTTPEKWDVITRKLDLRSMNFLLLLIIDEIHLLHDDRGPVLESIIVRAKRQSEIRLVGLSATLPNFEDVARFLQVDLKKGLFYFGPQYRPCPLEQQYMGIKEKKAIKKIAAMNEACYEKVVQCLENGHQVIVFVHLRKDTVKTAEWLRERLAESEKSALRALAGTQELLRQESETVVNRNLADVLVSGFGIHHAGLSRPDRSLVEDLFAQGYVQVLVSTATLAWGVNLPAHTVIIKGTDTYNPEKGKWVQLSPQDIIQMLGRAGRPRYDRSGEGVIITAHDELQYYLAILNQQLPIESQFMSKLADNLNAEIVLGTVASREDAVNWLAQTYLYIRMLQSGRLYRVGADYDRKSDPTLYWKRIDLVHSALVILQENSLLNYDSVLGTVTPTELGKIAAHFYIGYESAAMYNRKLRPWMLEIDVFQIFSYSGEFRYVPVRQEEKVEIRKLTEKCPVPIKEQPNDANAKINVLLQLYISRLRLEGFALTADMIYVTQSAGRLIRALHEISVKKKWAALSETTLSICKYVESRMWSTSSAFRQYGPLAPVELVRVTESSPLPFASYFQLSAAELSEALSFHGRSQLAHDLLKQYPRLSIECEAQPISPLMLRCAVEIVPHWEWNVKLHGLAERFLVLVANCDGDRLVYQNSIRITPKHMHRGYSFDFTVSFSGLLLGPALYISVVSEKWIHSAWRAPVKLFDMSLPKEPASLTRLLDVQSVPVSSLGDSKFSDMFSFAYFNKFQSQCFHDLWNTNESLFLGANKACGKTTLAELATLHAWRQNKQRVVYLQPTQEKIDLLLKEWSTKFASLTDPPKKVAKLVGDLTVDLRTCSQSHLVLATPAQFDVVSRRWRQRKLIQEVDLVVADDIHIVGSGNGGAVYETVMARFRFMAAHLGREIRIVALSFPLIYGRELGEWLGCSKKQVYNFGPNHRANIVSVIRLIPYLETRNLVLLVADQMKIFFTGDTKSRVVFVPSKKAALDLVSMFFTEIDLFSSVSVEEIESLLVRLDDQSLTTLLKRGLALFHGGMLPHDQEIVRKLFENNFIRVLLASRETCGFCPSGYSVLIYGTQTDDVHESSDYFLTEMTEMVGCCDGGEVLVFASAPKVEYYSHFLTNPMPVESHLAQTLLDPFVHEMCAKTINSKQACVDWITYTFFYWRLAQNPSFYGLKDTSHIGVSEYLSELVESTIEELEEAGMVEVAESDDEAGSDGEEEETISPLNGAMIATHYNVTFGSMKQIRKLSARSRLRNILETVSAASEFENLPIRPNEEPILAKLAQHVPLKLAADEKFEQPHVKAFLLLQAHFSRVLLSSELAKDQRFILSVVLRLVHACVDVLSSEGYLNALQAMDLSQMVVQGMWSNESPLYQIPHVSTAMMERGKRYQVETVFDVMSLEDDEREDFLRLEGSQLEAVADFVNKYPNIDVSYEIDMHSPMVVGELKIVAVTVERDEEMDDLLVESARYPFSKQESWWIVIGDSTTRQLYGVKKMLADTLSRTVNVEISVPSSGKHKLTIWCMCDSYVDADKEMLFEVDVLEQEKQ